MDVRLVTDDGIEEQLRRGHGAGAFRCARGFGHLPLVRQTSGLVLDPFMGSGSTAHGFTSPLATTVTSKATFELTPQARVCRRNAGCWSGAFAARRSSSGS